MIDRLLEETRLANWKEAERILVEHWIDKSPSIFSPLSDAQWDFKPNEHLINELVLHPIACAYCLDKDVGTDLSKLAEASGFSESARQRSSLCGHVFRCGEATYSCRECATDQTCVLCFQCFQKSSHKNHKYRMAASAGSGYCDCGDPEAWKQDPTCELHTIHPMEDEPSVKTDAFDENYNRVLEITRIILQFSTKMLCWQHEERAPDIIAKRKQDPAILPWQTLLFNDETHTYDSVIRALNLSIQCSEQQATQLATSVDREGRASIRSGSYEYCSKAKEEIQQRTKKDTNRRTEKTGPINLIVLDSRLVSSQNLSLRLVSWLTAQTTCFPSIAPVISDILLHQVVIYGKNEVSKEEAEDCNLLDCILKSDRALWKLARSQFHQLIMSTLLMNNETKLQFAHRFVKLYKKVFDDFIDDDHDQSVSVTSLTVQMFTVPTIARIIIAEDSAIYVILDALDSHIKKYLTETVPGIDPVLNFTGHTFPHPLRRALFMLVDLKYLLSFVPKETDWTEPMRRKFIHGCYTLLRLLKYMEGADHVQRLTHEHQLFEQEWETCFNIQIRMQRVIALTILWACSDKCVHETLTSFMLNKCVAVLKCEYKEDSLMKIPITVNNETAMCINFDVSRDRVSVHHPLWRFVAGLFTAPYPLLEVFAREQLRGKRAILCEKPLRVFVLLAQVSAHMWRRNGFSLVNQLHNYSSPICRGEMSDRDLQLLQVGAAVTSPNVFIIRVLHRFGLKNWAQPGFENRHVSDDLRLSVVEDFSKVSAIAAEEMFQLFIMIIGERYLPGVGKTSVETLLRREVIHILATGPKTFSKIEHAMPDSQTFAKLSLEKVLLNVADFREPTKAAAGLFTLKKEVFDEYCPFFYHYSRSDVSLATEYLRLRVVTGQNKKIVGAPPPPPPPFATFYEPIIHLLHSSVMVHLICLVLDRFAKKNRYSSEGVLYRVLYLIGMGLNEQMVNKNFEFLAKAEAALIFEKVSSLVGKPEEDRNNALIEYLLKQYKSLKRDDGGRSALNEGHEKNGAADLKARRAATAAKTKKRALDKINRLQKQFMSQNKTFFDVEARNEVRQGMQFVQADEDEEPIGLPPRDSGFAVCLGSEQIIVEINATRKITCILCQECETQSFTGNALVCVALMQKSFIFAKLNHSEDSGLLERPTQTQLFVSPKLRDCLHISTCGHIMHYACYLKYRNNILRDERARNRQTDSRLIDIAAGEYLCPLCKRISNALIPVLSPLSKLKAKPKKKVEKSLAFGDWLNTLSDIYLDAVSIKKQKFMKTHNRKRSHSERSLLELAGESGGKQEENALLASVPSTSATSLVMEGGGSSNPESRGEVAAENTPGRVSISESRFSALLSSLPVINSIKELLGPSEKMSTSTISAELSKSTSEMIRSFESCLTNFYTNDANPHFETGLLSAVAVWQSTAFSLRSIAMFLRRNNKPLFGAWNTRQKQCIYSLSRICALSPIKCHPRHMHFLLLALLSPLLRSADDKDKRAWLSDTSITDPTSPKTGRPPEPVPISTESEELERFISIAKTMEKPVSLLKIDMLSLAVQLAMCIGRARLSATDCSKTAENFPDGSQDEHFVIRLVLIAHLYQVFATFPTYDSATDEDMDEDELSVLIACLHGIVHSGTRTASVVALKKALYTAVREFLRPLSLLYHALTLVPPPEGLKDPSVDEFEPLCRYLGFSPSLEKLLGGHDGDTIKRLFAMWSSQERNFSKSADIVSQPVMENALVKLPADFSDLIQRVANFRCPSVNSDALISSVPTLCLVCGTLLCSQSYCCQRTIRGSNAGACICHMFTCSGPSGGMFLRIRDCQLVLLTSRNRGCLQAAPYIDQYGETDFGFGRGNPLHLSEELYAKLENIWFGQDITEEVVNQAENDHRNLGFEWQHF